MFARRCVGPLSGAVSLFAALLGAAPASAWQSVLAIETVDPAAQVPVAECTMPPPSAKAKVVLLGLYDTQALSSTSLGSQDAVVHAGRIVVEPGGQPLYIVATSFSAVIWRFGGSIDRIEQVVLSANATGANRGRPDEPFLVGATGLPASKTAFMQRSNCLPWFSEAPSSQSVRAISSLRRMIGRDPDVVAAAYDAMGFRVPSGQLDTAKRAPLGGGVGITITTGASRPEQDLARYNPGGVAAINPSVVVSSAPAIAYEVLPQEAGLAQLLKSGAMKQNRGGEYVVQKPTRFPPGLHGGHSVTFVVPKGVAVPEGDPGHSCVAVEDPAQDRFRPCVHWR